MKRKEPLWIEERDAYAIHDRLLALHGGATGVRDRGLLESALARPRQHYVYADDTSIVDMAALYTAAIVQNHPFFDGNKRTGFVIGVVFLELNGFEFQASEAESTQIMLALAAGRMTATSYAAWLQVNEKKRRRL